MPRKLRSSLQALTVLAAVGAAIYTVFLRKRQLRWGTSESRAQDQLPGDELVPESELLLQTTRSVTIRAAPVDIWPWLVQIGQGRGGFYSYDWLENLFRMDIHNTERILPEYQRLEVGDCIPFWKNVGVTVRSIEPNRFLVLAGSMSPDTDQTGGSWAFILEPLGSQVTRLVVRTRVASFSPAWLSRLFSLLLLEPAHFVMERKMVMTIQSRAESRRSNPLLLDEFMPHYDFNEVHKIPVNAPVEQVYQAVKELRPEELSPLVYAMLNLRQLPAILLGKDPPGKNSTGDKPFLEQLYAGGFIHLVDDPNRQEIVFGLIGQFWKLNGGEAIRVDDPQAFCQFRETDYAKVAANLVVQHIENCSLLSTETRIWAPDDSTRQKFASYWKLISMGSGWIRILWLKAIKRRAEYRYSQIRSLS